MKSKAVYCLSCAIVLIVLAACVSTVMVTIYFSADSPWRDKDNTTCTGSANSQSGSSDGAQQGTSDDQEGDTVTTQTKMGTIEGKLVASPFDSLVERYLGIPYAEPPVGGNRFRDPQPMKHNYPGGVFKATEYGASCFQPIVLGDPISDLYRGLKFSENCLFLNIWVPRPKRDNRAVMVWIYGGAFTTGSSSILPYDGRGVSSFGDVIVVSMNYRVASLGFLSLDIPGSSRGNQGLKDQQLALKWIQENIQNFGGDPRQVTLFGESAGGASASFHLLAPSSNSLFNRAITQSGTPLAMWAVRSQQDAEFIANQIPAVFNCTEEENVLECLQAVPAQEFIDMSATVTSTHPLDSTLWKPVADGEFIPAPPEELIASGSTNQKDVMIGINKDEGSIFSGWITAGDAPYTAVYQGYAGGMANFYQVSSPIELVQRYSPQDANSSEEARSAVAGIIGDALFVCPANTFSRIYSNQGSKVYFNHLTYGPDNPAVPDHWGVFHTSDIQWVFGHPFLNLGLRTYTPEEALFAKSIMTMWTNFAKYGDPDPSGDLNWIAYSTRSPSYLELAGPFDFRSHRNATVREEFCQLWM